jgi:methyl-accepting chemotaxis protein
MNVLNKLNIGGRLAVGFGLLIACSLAIAIYGRVSLTAVSDELHLLTDDRIVKVTQARDIKDNLNQIARSLRNILIMTEAEQKAAEARTIEQARAANAELIKKLDETIKSERGRQLLTGMASVRGAYNTAVDKAIAAAVASRIDEGRTLLLNEVRPAQAAYFKALDDLVQFQTELMVTAKKETTEAVDHASLLMLVIAALCGLLGALIGWLVTRSVTKPLADAMATTSRIAAGDLTSTIRATGSDEVSHLLQSLLQMQDSLRNVVGEVRTGVESVSTASGQIAAGNQDLSSRTEEQASSLQQTAASMEELTSTVKQSTDNARQANQLASTASEAASKGGAVVGQVVSTMEDITASSRKIADIISVIDGIAFQTNILALNAAVEAARAGEQGRGFAVVAGEVRNLAQRSAQAAREIKVLISDSVDRVDAGSKQVAEAGAAMNEIVVQVRRVTDLIGEITSAAIEQSSGIGQVNDAITQMDQVTQQNAALVEESAAAAASLKAQANQLAQSVAVFKLSDGEVRVTTAEPPAARAAATGRRPKASVTAPAPAVLAGTSAAKSAWQEF